MNEDLKRARTKAWASPSGASTLQAAEPSCSVSNSPIYIFGKIRNWRRIYTLGHRIANFMLVKIFLFNMGAPGGLSVKTVLPHVMYYGTYRGLFDNWFTFARPTTS